MTSSSTPGLARFNALAAGEAVDALREVCAGEAWGRAVLDRRPYATVEALLRTSDAATAGLTEDGLAEALAGHPPIGRPTPGDPVSSHEQRGMADASDELRAEMLALNLAYQERFGHVFLICATGATAEQMRDAVKSRLGNSPEQEREHVRIELGRINRLRLIRLLEELAGATVVSTAATASVSTHVLDTSLGRPAAAVPVLLAARSGGDGGGDGDGTGYAVLGGSVTGADGRCTDLPALPEGTTHVRLVFDTESYVVHRKQAGDSGAFFPEVAVTFAVAPGEHYHVPLLLNPFGYSVYRGS